MTFTPSLSTLYLKSRAPRGERYYTTNGHKKWSAANQLDSKAVQVCGSEPVGKSDVVIKLQREVVLVRLRATHYRVVSIIRLARLSATLPPSPAPLATGHTDSLFTYPHLLEYTLSFQ